MGVSALEHDTSLVMTIGAVLFGAVVGFITYRTLVRTTDKAAISDLGAVVGVIGGGAVTGLFDPHTSDLFGWYAIGLAAGLAAYFLLFALLNGLDKTAKVMGKVTTPIDRVGPGGPRA
jgi:hypothetical protein